MSFSTPFVYHRTRKDKFYSQVNRLVDWQPIEKEINRHYKANRGEVGRDGYEGMLLFKMLLLGIFNGLSDYGVEDLVNDSLSASRFCGLELEDNVPDHSVLSRFRGHMVRCGGFDKLLRLFNHQLKEQGLMVQKVVKVDASITDAPRKPRGRKVYETDGKNTKEYQPPRVDKQAGWIKKEGKLRYGYKKHIITDDEGLVIALKTTKASRHDSGPFKGLVAKAHLPKGCEVQADKAYRSGRHDDFLRKQHLGNGILHRAYRNKPLTRLEIERNKVISKTRYQVERTFGSMVSWFGSGKARYVGLDKTHAQHVLEAMAYNLKRLPRLFIQKQLAASDG